MTLYAVSQGEIVRAPEQEQFWIDGISDFKETLQHHGYCTLPDVRFGDDGFSIEVFREESAKTEFAKKYAYIACYSLAFGCETVMIPGLGELNAFLNQTVPLCIAELQQSAHDLKVDEKREAEHAKRRLSGQMRHQPPKPARV